MEMPRHSTVRSARRTHRSSLGPAPRAQIGPRRPGLTLDGIPRQNSWTQRREEGAMAEIRVIATGLRFPEGPVAMADGSIILGEIAGSAVTRVAPDGSKSAIGSAGGGAHGVPPGPPRGAVSVTQ